jgi:phospholipid transport system substrate-binding protein
MIEQIGTTRIWEDGKMKIKLSNFTPAVGLLVMLAIHPSHAAAGQAADQVKQTVDRVLGILNDPSLKGEAKKAERREKLREVIYARFDFPDMAKRSLGAQWQKRSPAEQKEFTKAFTDLLEGAYVDKFESYNGEKVRFVNDRQDQDYAEVSTKVVDKKGQEYSVDYRLHQVNGDWKVSDVVIENVSLVNNYRSQFNRVLAKSSYQELIETMKQKKFSAPAAKS